MFCCGFFHVEWDTHIYCILFGKGLFGWSCITLLTAMVIIVCCICQDCLPSELNSFLVL